MRPQGYDAYGKVAASWLTDIVTLKYFLSEYLSLYGTVEVAEKGIVFIEGAISLYDNRLGKMLYLLVVIGISFANRLYFRIHFLSGRKRDMILSRHLLFGKTFSGGLK